MKNWKEVIGALLGVLTGFLWLGFAFAGFPLLPAIIKIMVLGVLGAVFFGKLAQIIIKKEI